MKILALIHHPKGGCEYYRQIIPLDIIRGEEIEVKGTNNIEEMTDAEISLFDIFFIIRKDIFVLNEVKVRLEQNHPLTEEQYQQLSDTRMIDRCKRLGLKVIFDIDDYWNLNQTHLLYHRYKKMNMVENTINCISKADLVTTTQSYLLDKIKPHNANVHVIPNCIHPSHKQWSESKNLVNEKVRIGWIGGVHHIEDIKLLRECFMKLWNDSEINDKVQFVLGGYSSDSDFSPTSSPLCSVVSLSR